jgi:hypothetical protein
MKNQITERACVVRSTGRAPSTGKAGAQRLTQMFGALSATNEALLRARMDETFQNVWDAAATGGPLGAAAVFLARP